MQSILVLPFDRADFVHSEEVVQLRHLASRTEHEILIKDLDLPEAPQGKVGVLFPLAAVDDLVVEGGYLSVVLSSQDGKGLMDRWEEIQEFLDRMRPRTKALEG